MSNEQGLWTLLLHRERGQREGTSKWRSGLCIYKKKKVLNGRLEAPFLSWRSHMSSKHVFFCVSISFASHQWVILLAAAPMWLRWSTAFDGHLMSDNVMLLKVTALPRCRCFPGSHEWNWGQGFTGKSQTSHFTVSSDPKQEVHFWDENGAPCQNPAHVN